MGQNTKIEWASLGLNRSASFNPLRAFRKDDGKRGWMCVHKNSACKFCYAERMNKNRYYGNGLSYAVGSLSKVDLQLVDVTAPLWWKVPRGIFWCSMTDWMGEFVLQEYVDAMLSTALNAKQHRHAFLTKRPERMLEYFSGNWRERIMFDITSAFPRHVWLGVSIHDQECAKEFMPHIMRLREVLGESAVIWLSVEPLLGEVDLSEWITENTKSFDWVVVGGESGREARPMREDWVIQLRDQCVVAGVPFFFKQWGRYVPRTHQEANDAFDSDSVWVSPEGDVEATTFLLGDLCICDYLEDGFLLMGDVGKKNSGRLLDGREWNEYPTACYEN